MISDHFHAMQNLEESFDRDTIRFQGTDEAIALLQERPDHSLENIGDRLAEHYPHCHLVDIVVVP
jgi:hypothetical protein